MLLLLVLLMMIFQDSTLVAFHCISINSDLILKLVNELLCSRKIHMRFLFMYFFSFIHLVGVLYLRIWIRQFSFLDDIFVLFS